MPIWRRPEGTPEVRAEITSHLVKGQIASEVTSIAYDGDAVPSDYIIRGQVLQFGNHQHGGGPYTNEILLAIVLDRLKHLQQVLPCNDNVGAIHAVYEALETLKLRTLNRIKRGVEGTNQP